MAPRHEDQTRELIELLRKKRSRRRWSRVLLGGIVTLLVLAGLITGVVLATAAPGGPASGSTSSSVAEVSTTHRAVTTETTATETTATEPTATERTAAETVTTAVAPSTSDTVTAAGVTTTSALATTTTANWLAGKVIVIDPGHQGHADSGLEPIGPGSKQMKAKVSGGTSSVLTGIPESQVTLAVGLKLRAALQALGVQVVMTRTTENVDISNIQRARIGNTAGADLTVRLHCNGSGDHSIHGLFTLYPASIKGWTDDIAAASFRAATITQRDLIAATGAQDRGLEKRSDLTGFNWSDVPVILVEMGYMTNPTEDTHLRTPGYQDKIVQGLVRGVIDYLKTE